MRETAAFNNVFITPRVRAALARVVDVTGAKKFWDLVDKLRSGRFDIPGLNVEKLHTRRGKVYSARMNIEMRVIFTMSAAANDRNLVVLDLNHHDDAYNRVDRVNLSANLEAALELVPEQAATEQEDQDAELEMGEDITGGMMLFQVPYYVLAAPDKFVSFEKSIDRYLKLSDEQEELLGKLDRSYSVQGSAGTGKTTLALFHALNLFEANPDDEIFLFTYHDELACVCRAYKDNLIGGDEPESGGIRVLSYIDFCRHYLKSGLAEKLAGRRWATRAESLELIKATIASRKRWRTFSAQDVWGVTYSLLKGRFVPGEDRLPTSKEDYLKIFKDYGRLPDSLDDLMEIYEQYQERLRKAKLLDEADMIAMGFEMLCQRSILSSDRKVWIVMDEIQDFTELEWKSILLFWENQCKASASALSFPFLSGDVNQNISRSGFRWQELNSYLEKTFKKFHRPNALMKVQLHQNFRNTREIFDLAVFIREFAAEQSYDLGVAPTHHGLKPQLIIGPQEEFVEFIKNIETDNGPPLVILSENDNCLDKLRPTRGETAFVLPLRASKGMEFEDVIICRLFSSAAMLFESGAAAADKDDREQMSQARLFDLWYMGLTRARRSLLIFMEQSDLDVLKSLLQDRFDDFCRLVEFSDLKTALPAFYRQREQHIPNYNVVFLERRVAAERWQQYLAEKGNPETAESAGLCARRAVELWLRCSDYASLGKAYLELEQYEQALPYLKRCAMSQETAYCLVLTQQFSEAAAIYETEGLAEDAARSWECAGEFLRAAEIYERLENWAMAAENFGSAQEYAKAAECCEKAGMLRSAADLQRFRANHLKAAELYVKVNDWALAAEMYLKVKDKLDAARCFEKAGNFERAGKLLESLNRWGEAAVAYENGKQFKKSGQLYSRAGELLPAAKAFLQSGDKAEAAALFERARGFEQAGELYCELGKLASAAQCMEKAGQWHKALEIYEAAGDVSGKARCLEQIGDLETAAQLFSSRGCHTDAAYCYEKASMWAEAADHYLKDSSYASAANMLAKMERRFDAARLYLLGGQAASAMELLKGHAGMFEDLLTWTLESGRPDLQAQLLEQRKEYVKAAKVFEQCMMLSRAAECYEKSKHPLEAAKLFQRDGKLAKAADCFKLCQRWTDAALCLEKLKRWDDAAKMYDRAGDQDSAARCRAAVKWF